MCIYEHAVVLCFFSPAVVVMGLSLYVHIFLLLSDSAYIGLLFLPKGHVECWDPRSRTRVGKVDVATNNLGLERCVIL